MRNKKGFKETWTNTGKYIAQGGQISKSELLAIYDNLQLNKINPDYLPGENTVLGKVRDRKDVMFDLVERFWGYTPEMLLQMEDDWLDESRTIYPSQSVEGKDNLEDVISAEILTRLIAAAKLVKESDNKDVIDEAIFAVNLTLLEVCAKGRTRLKKVDGRSIYGILRSNGLMIGTGGGKYLPLPEKSMPELLMMLHRDYIRPGVYLD